MEKVILINFCLQIIIIIIILFYTYIHVWSFTSFWIRKNNSGHICIQTTRTRWNFVYYHLLLDCWKKLFQSSPLLVAEDCFPNGVDSDFPSNRACFSAYNLELRDFWEFRHGKANAFRISNFVLQSVRKINAWSRDESWEFILAVARRLKKNVYVKMRIGIIFFLIAKI